MWTTTFKHGADGVEEMTHDFGNGVRVVTNFKEKTTCRYHGDVCVKEFTMDTEIERYVAVLRNVAEEISGGEGNTDKEFKGGKDITNY